MASILIVDDDPVVRAIARQVLTLGDHAISEAADGVEALKILGLQPFDLVVLDMLMPGKDGLEVLRDLREASATIKILAISSGGRAGAKTYLETARIFGADETMQKPLRLLEFSRVVERLLARAGPTQNPWIQDPDSSSFEVSDRDRNPAPFA